MSRRGSVLENYKVPDLTNPINPLAAHEMVSRERMHGQEMEQAKQQQKAKAQQQREKDLGDLEVKPGNSGTIYDPTGLKATQDLNIEMMEYAKSNPDKSIAEIKMNFAPQANKIAQYYEKAKTIKANNKVALEGLQKLGGYNLSEIDLLAQKEALIDPTTGKIRDDIDMIDVTQPYWKMAIEKNPLETTTNEGLHEYVTKAETTPSRVKVKRVDKNKGMVTDELVLTVPSFIQIEKDAKNNPVISETGTYGLEPKFETLPNGTKILDEAVFKDLKNNKPSAYQRLMGEVAQFIKTNNDESDDNIAPDSVEAQNIARMLAYKDIKQVWGNKGVAKYDAVVQPPAPKITINNGSGGGSDARNLYNDTWGRIANHYKKSKEKYLSRDDVSDDIKKEVRSDKFLTAINQLDTEAINLISAQVNAGRSEENKISPDDMYVSMTDGRIEVYMASKDKDGKKVGYKNKDNLKGVLPPSANLKAPQSNTKAKVSAQEEARRRENEISGKKDQPKKVYKANYKGGIITSTDGVNWIDSKGNKVQ